MFDDEDESQDNFFNGNLKEDLKKFDAFLAGEPIGFLDSDKWEALIDHFLIAGQYNKALLCAKEALTQFSYNTLFQLRKAQSLSATGDLKQSLNILNDLERGGMESMEMLLTKASVFSQLKDTKNAIKYFKASLLAAAPEDRDEIYLDLAMEYQNRGEYKLAINVLIEAKDANPSNEGAVYELAFCYDQLGATDKAIECYSGFIDNNPYSFTGWYNLGNAYAKLEDFEKALWAYDYCVVINDDFGPAYFNLGHTNLSLNKYTKAIECFEKCMTLDGDDPLALCYIGECHEQLEELTLARHYYKRSLELAPMLPDAWLGMGIVEDMEGKTKEGIVLIMKAFEIDPENPSISHVLAGAYEKIDKREEAQEYYELSIGLEPSDEECLLNYVNFISDESQQAALEYLDVFEASGSQNEIFNILKVSVLWNLGHFDQSTELFKICVTTDREKAREIFEINPALKNVSEFVLLCDQ